MNHKRIMWILTLGLVVITVAATLNTRISRSEATANPVPEPSPPDLSKIGQTITMRRSPWMLRKRRIENVQISGMMIKDGFKSILILRQA